MRISKRIGLFAATTAGIAMIVLAAQAFAPTAPYYAPVGTIRTCNVSGTAGIGGLRVTYTALGSFQTLSNSATLPASTTLNASGFTGSGQSPQLGEVRLSLVPTSSTLSTITANQSSSSLPATGTLRFNVDLTISSQPNAIYRSNSPVEMVNSNITAWPHRDAVYGQAGTVTLTNINDRTQTIQLSGSSATLNGGAN